jgi:hypothetical protein
MIITRALRALWNIHFNILLKILIDSVTNFHYTLGLLRKENIIIGSLFVQTLVQQWYLNCNKGIHILELLTDVNSVIHNKLIRNKVWAIEAPFIISSLRKRLFIGPIVGPVTDSGDIVPFGMLLNISEHQFTVWYAYLIVYKDNTIDSTVDTSLNESDSNDDSRDWYVIAIGMSDDNYDDMIMNKEFLIAF